MERMRLLGLKASTHELTYHRPFLFGQKKQKNRQVTILEAQGEVGGRAVRGWGECAPLPAFGTESEEVAAAVIEAVMRSPIEVELTPTIAAIADLLGRARGLAASGCARAAIQSAVACAAASTCDTSLARWLEPGAAARVRVNALVGLHDDAGAPDLARARDRVRGHNQAEDGAPTIKLKLGLGEWSAEVAAVCALLREFGGVRWRLDVNEGWPAHTAVARLRELADRLGDRVGAIEYVEQPVPAADAKSLALMQRETPFLIAADESLLDSAAREMLLESANPPSVFVLKPSALGGPFTTVSIALQAIERGISCVVTTLAESAVGRAMAVHVAAAVDGLALRAGLPARAHGLDTGHLLATDIETDPPITVDRGWITVPTGAGLGVTPRMP